MKILKFTCLGLICLISSCVSIPKETVTLSKTLGNDLVILHNTNRNTIQLYYQKIKNDINKLIDDVYAPFVIHFVLKKELKSYNNKIPSLYGDIENAGRKQTKEATEKAIEVMQKFQEAAKFQIDSKRKELLEPIIEQENKVIEKINLSYENAIYANATITAYLISVKKVKDSRNQALNAVGVNSEELKISERLTKLSNSINSAIIKGKEIDVKSDNALKKINDVINKVKTN